MPLQNSNPTNTNAWKKLEEHFNEMTSFTIQKAFKDDVNRKNSFSVDFNDLKSMSSKFSNDIFITFKCQGHPT